MRTRGSWEREMEEVEEVGREHEECIHPSHDEEAPEGEGMLDMAVGMMEPVIGMVRNQATSQEDEDEERRALLAAQARFEREHCPRCNRSHHEGRAS